MRNIRNTTTVRLAALAVAAAVGLTACGAGSSGSTIKKSALRTTTPAGTQSVAAVTWGLPDGEPTSIDPILVGASSEMTVSSNMCENLLALQPDFSVEPGLATSANWSHGGKTLTLDIHPGVKFWDGKPLTADDVVYSLQRTANPKTGSYYTDAFAHVTSIAKTGPLQVTLSLDAPDYQLRNALAGATGNVVEKAYAEKQGKKFGTVAGGLMCTGPYKFVSWKSGDSITMVANHDYWNGTPKVEKITFRFLGDVSTLTSALRAGTIDGAYDLPIAAAVALSKSKVGTIYRGPSTSSLSFGPTSTTGPGADPRVRTALDLAIDKQALIKSVLRGLGTIQRTFTAPLAWSGDPAAATYRAAYDALPADDTPNLTEARKLVKEAGAEGKTLVMVIPAGSTTETQAATLVQAAAKKIGITIKLRTLQPTPFSALFYSPQARSGTDFVLTIGYQEVPGPLYYAPEFATKDGLYNWSGYQNDQVTKLLNAARSTTDPEVSAKNFNQAQTIFNSARLQVTLAGLDSLLYLKKGLTGAPASVAYYSSPWALHLGGTGK